MPEQPDPPSRPADPWPTCDSCQDRMHLFCLALTADQWCSCPCGWIWPNGQPDPFWLTTPTDAPNV